MKKINICFVTDENYAQYVGVVITSILKNSGNNVFFNFYIFDNEIKENTKLKFKKIEKEEKQRIAIHFIDISSVADKIKKLKQTVPHISKASYFKFVIADLLPSLDKIIYLDGDLIVKKSLDSLYDIDLGDNLIAAVEDVGYTYWSKINDEFKLKFKCMNSGVMLINCKLWRKENLSNKLIKCSCEHEKVGFGQDQPVLNYILKDRVLFIPFVWNVQDTFFRDEIELEDRNDKQDCIFAKNYPNIIHYTYIKKPWNYPLIHKADEYWKYYEESVFFDKLICKHKNMFLKQYAFFKFVQNIIPNIFICKKINNILNRLLNDFKENNFQTKKAFWLIRKIIGYIKKKISGDKNK